MRYVVLAACCLAAVIAYVHRSCLAVPASLVRRDLQLSLEDMGTILGVFYLGYAVFQIPAGWLGGRLGTRVGLPLFMAIWASAVELMPLANGFAFLFLLQLINGMAQAAIFPCCVQSFARWFPDVERAFPSGLLGAFMSVGAALASFLTGRLLGFMTWQELLMVYALPGFVFAGLFFWWFRDHPADHTSVNNAELEWITGKRTVAKKEPPPPVPWLQIFTSATMWLICAQQFFRAAGYVFYVTFFPLFLQNARNVTVEQSGQLGALPLLGVVLGSTTGGLVMDQILKRTGSRRLSRQGIALVGVSGAAVFLALAFFVEDALGTVLLMTLSTFSAGMTGPAGYTVTIDAGGRHIATVFSIMNTAGNVGATLLAYVLPHFVRFTSWDDVLFFQASLYAAAGVCWLLLPIHRPVFREPVGPEHSGKP